MKRLLMLLGTLFVATASGVAAADETHFPSRQRTLETTAPAECREWVAPLPERRVKVTLPSNAKRAQGSARLTITISPDGLFGGLVDALTNDAVFVQAATDSLQYWSFVPARCNGVAVATQATLFFNFRHEPFLSFVSGNYLQ
jgi:Gram-negative bacterial TonB protein C-terminal